MGSCFLQNKFYLVTAYKMDASVHTTEPTTPSNQTFHLPQVKLDGPSHTNPNRFSVATFEDHGPISTNVMMGKSRKRFLKNCIECTRAHRRCVFYSADDLQCTRCLKFNMSCQFRYSGMCSRCYAFFYSNNFLSVINL